MDKIPLLALAALLVALAVFGCAEPGTGRPIGHRVGATTQQFTSCLPPLNPVTGNSATIVIYDTTAQKGFKSDRVTVSVRYDQAVTILFQGLRFGSTTWRTLNGSGDAVTANTDTFKDYLVQTSNSRVEIVTGATGPTTTVETDVCLPFERSLGQ